MTLRVSPQTPRVDQSVTFEAHADGESIDACTWDFTGDGTADATGETARHRFEGHGRHEVTATVTDTDGETVELTRAVSVSPPVQWTFEVGHRVRSSPAVMDSTVFVGSDDRSVYAIGAVSGETEWTFETDGRIRSSAAMAGDTILFGTTGGSVYALDAATGKQEWQFETGDAVTSSPAVANGTVFVGSEDKKLYALDADSGEVNWQYSIVNPVDTAPTVAENTVFVGNYNLYALDADSGEERWVFRAGGKIRSSPAVAKDTVFVGSGVSGSNSGKLYAIDVTSGEQEWSAYMDGPIRSSPTVVDGTVFLGDGDSNVYALDARSGERRWTAETGGSIESSPTVAEGTVFVGSLDGSVYALDEASGVQRWTVETDSSVVASPTVAEGTVFVGSDDGRVYALETAIDGSSDDSRAMLDSPDDDGRQTGQTSTPAQFDVTVRETETPVAGEELPVTVEVSATDGSRTTQTIVVTVPGLGSASTEVTLDGEDSTVETLSVPTAVGEAGEYTATVESDDDSVTEQVTISRPTAFLLELVDTNAPIETGDDLEVTVEVYNAMNHEETQTVELSCEGLGSDVRILTLDTETATRETLSLATARGDSGEYTATVSTGGDEVTASVLIEQAPTIDVSAIETNAPVGPGESLDVTIEVRNPGDAAATQTVGIDIEGIDSTTREQTLAAGASDTIPLSIPAGALGSGTCTITVSTDEDSVTETVNLFGSDAEPNDDGTAAASLDGTADPVETAVPGQRVDSLAGYERIPDPERVTTPPRSSLAYDDIGTGDRIGSGGNADVYYATAALDGGEADIALKKPRMSGTLHTEVVERMMAEAQTWQRLDDHDHIVGVVDYGSEPLPWIAMEYMDGGHLGERAEDLPFEQAIWTAIAMTKAVRHAHRRGVAHLDLKPENILFRSVESVWDVPKVADWGLSKHLLNHSKSVDGITTDYAAPEQFADGYGNPDDITDIYQLGAVLYELFTGRPPFEGKPMRVMRKIETEQPTPPSERADVPERIDDVLLTALAKNKADRYETVVHLRNDLQELW